VERQFGSGVSLLVFLTLFFANFAVSWLAVILVMDGSLREAQGRQSQLDIERAGRASMTQRQPKGVRRLTALATARTRRSSSRSSRDFVSPK
jgi:hypothetical protein